MMDVSGVLISWDTLVIRSVFSRSFRMASSTARLRPPADVVDLLRHMPLRAPQPGQVDAVRQIAGRDLLDPLPDPSLRHGTGQDEPERRKVRQERQEDHRHAAGGDRQQLEPDITCCQNAGRHRVMAAACRPLHEIQDRPDKAVLPEGLRPDPAHQA